MRFGAAADPWLSELLGRKSFRIFTGSEGSDATEVFDRLGTEPLFLTAKIDACKISDGHHLEDLGFRLVDTALTFETAPICLERSPDVTFAKEADKDAVIAIARTAFEFSRFHADPAIPDSLANTIKAEWVGNFFNGRRGEAMLIARVGSEVAGFLLLMRALDGSMIIDLVAVSPTHARCGLGSQMVTAAMAYGMSNGGTGRIVVGTQASNRASVNLYESLGFSLHSTQHVFHHHGVHTCYANTLEIP